MVLFQASGVTVSDACKTTYEGIKKDKKNRYVVFYIKDEKQIDVEKIGMCIFLNSFLLCQNCTRFSNSCQISSESFQSIAGKLLQ